MFFQNYILKIKKNNFIKNVITLFSGSVIAQAIGILFMPLLSRIYTTEEFGTLGVYMSIVSILSIIAGGSYEQAVMLPKNKNDAFHVVVLSVFVAAIFSFVVFVISLFFNSEIAKLLNNSELEYWIFLVPVSLLFIVTYKALSYWFNRINIFKEIATSKVIRSGSNSGISVIGGFLKLGSLSLISAWISGQVLSVLYLFIKLSKGDYNLIKEIKLETLKKLSIKYKKFPLFDSWSELLGVLSIELPVLLISFYFGKSITGNYTFAYKLLMVPTTLITYSIGQAFYQKAALIKENLNELSELTLLTIKRLLIIAVVPVAVVSVFGTEIFVFVLGSEWKLAGDYSQYMVIWVLITFISSPFTVLFLIFNSQNIKFIFYVVNTFVQIALLVAFTNYFTLSSKEIITYFWLVNSFFRFIYLILILRNIKISFKKPLFLLLKYFVPVYLLLLLFKNIIC